MAITTGAIPTCASWTERCDQIKILLGSLPALTLCSDTGTGNTRVLLYSLPGTGHMLKIYNSGTIYFLTLKLDGTTNLYTITGSFTATAEWGYRIITNGNLTYVRFSESIYVAQLLCTKCGTVDKSFMGIYFPHPTQDSYLTSMADYTGYVKKPTKSGKQILFPAFAPGDSISTDVEELPMDDVYCFANTAAVAPYGYVTINSLIYMVCNFNYTTSRHLIKCE